MVRRAGSWCGVIVWVLSTACEDPQSGTDDDDEAVAESSSGRGSSGSGDPSDAQTGSSSGADDGGPNEPPMATDDRYTLDGTGSLVVTPRLGVLVNDVDPDEDELEVFEWERRSASGGTVNMAASGGFVYEPGPSLLFGIDVFTYRVRDPSGEEDEGTVEIVVSVL